MSLTLHFVHVDGRRQPVQAKAGQTLMKAAVAGGIEAVAADCGGTLSCATCHVLLRDAGWAALPAVAGDEQAMLEMTAEPAQASSRLSCQVRLQLAHDGLEVHLPARQY